MYLYIGKLRAKISMFNRNMSSLHPERLQKACALLEFCIINKKIHSLSKPYHFLTKLSPSNIKCINKKQYIHKFY